MEASKRWAAAWFAFGGSLCLAGRLHAQDGGCPAFETSAPLAVTPAVGAGGVTLDVVIRVEYPPGGAPSGMATPLVELWEASSARRVEGRIETLGGDWVIFVPDGLLEPETAYEGVARGEEGDLAFHFRTGMRRDEAPPGPVAIERVVVRELMDEPACAPAEGYGFSVLFSPSEEDGPPASVEYFLYQTRGRGLEAPRLLGRTRGFSSSSLTIGFSLPREEADGPICLSILALDGVGRLSTPGPLQCVDPVDEGFFVSGCRLGPRERGAGDVCVWLVVSLTLAFRRLRSVRRGRPMQW